MIERPLLALRLIAVIGFVLGAQGALAAPMIYNFSYSAGGSTDPLLDSNGNTSPVLGNGTISGGFSFLADFDQLIGAIDDPLLSFSPITIDSGEIFDLSNTLVTYRLQTVGVNWRIEVGAVGLTLPPNRAGTLVGGSDDFRLIFFVDLGGNPLPGLNPAPLFPEFTYNNAFTPATPSGGAYVGRASVSLTSVQSPAPVPLPMSGAIMAGAIAGLGCLRRPSRRGALRS